MHKILTDIYGGIYVTEKAVLNLQHELRKQKTATGFLAISLLALCGYVLVDLRADAEQSEKIKKLESDIRALKAK